MTQFYWPNSIKETPVIPLSDHVRRRDGDGQLIHHLLPINGHSYMTLTLAHTRETTRFQRKFEEPERKAAMHFLLNGQTVFDQQGKVPTARFNGDKCNLMLIQRHETHQIMECKGDFMMASFYLDLDYLLQLTGPAAEALPPGFIRAIHKNVCSCNNYTWNPAAYRTLLQISQLDISSPLSSQILENKLLELLAMMIESEACDYFSRISIGKNDVEKIYYARELLMNDLVRPPSLQQLARLVATNEFTLKKGFREVFGKPVYQYLIQRKMEKAMRLLMTTRMPVAEIGFQIGYEDHAAFSRAFRRYYRLSPTEIR